MLRLRPYANAVMKRIFGAPTFDEAATSVSVIEPEMEMRQPASVSLEGEFERIRNFAPGDTLEAAKLKAFGGSVRKRPLKRYEFKDMLVFPTGLSTSRATYMRDASLPHRLLLTQDIPTLTKALSTHTPVSIRYFGHWLSDSCPTALFCEEDEALLMTHRPAWPHAYDYCPLFDIAPKDAGVFHVEKLTWMDDVGQGPSRMERCQRLRRRLRANVKPADLKTPPPSRIYLRRGATGMNRTIANEEALIDRLSKQGFVTVDMQHMSVPEIMRAAIDADICVTMDGSHQNHAFYFLRDHGLLCMVQPADRFSLGGFEMGAGAGYATAFTIADPSPDGYVVDADKILRTIDLWQDGKAAQI